MPYTPRISLSDEDSYIVHCLDLSPAPTDDFLAAKDRLEQHQRGTSLYYHTLDVRDGPATTTLFKQISQGHFSVENDITRRHTLPPRFDGLVAAAGVQHLENALDYTPSDIHKMFEVNYTGVLLSAQAAARTIISTSTPAASIVLVASMSAFVANKGLKSSIYNSSKAAVVQLARNLAMEWARYGIRVNALCPGHTLTPMVEENFKEVGDGLREVWERENMLGRMARPGEMVGGVVFMLSEASSFMTGASLVIDGGHTAW